MPVPLRQLEFVTSFAAAHSAECRNLQFDLVESAAVVNCVLARTGLHHAVRDPIDSLLADFATWESAEAALRQREIDGDDAADTLSQSDDAAKPASLLSAAESRRKNQAAVRNELLLGVRATERYIALILFHAFLRSSWHKNLPHDTFAAFLAKHPVFGDWLKAANPFGKYHHNHASHNHSPPQRPISRAKAAFGLTVLPPASVTHPIMLSPTGHVVSAGSAASHLGLETAADPYHSRYTHHAVRWNFQDASAYAML